jgi:hypothetical protein
VRRPPEPKVVQVGRVHGVGRGGGNYAALKVDVDIGLVARDEARAERDAGCPQAERSSEPRAVAYPPGGEHGQPSYARDRSWEQ